MACLGGGGWSRLTRMVLPTRQKPPVGCVGRLGTWYRVMFLNALIDHYALAVPNSTLTIYGPMDIQLPYSCRIADDWHAARGMITRCRGRFDKRKNEDL